MTRDVSEEILKSRRKVAGICSSSYNFTENRDFSSSFELSFSFGTCVLLEAGTIG